MNELGPPRLVEGLWFDDGNIILRAGNSVHKLHKSILSLHSTILADMFGIPQPDVAESFDGLPVVELPDGEADVVHWLRSLLIPGYFEISPSKISTDKLFAALRLSHKYDCQYLRRRSLVHLSTMFATDVEGMRQLLREFPASCSIKYTSDELQTYCTALSVAREVGATWLLPDIYYNLHVLASGLSDPLAEALSKEDPLTAADVVSVYKVTNLVLRLFHIPDLVSLSQSCKTGSCATGSGANLNGLAPALYTDPITFFMPPSPQNARQYPGDALEDVLCQDCMRNAQMARYRRVDQELSRLQSLFERTRDTVSAQGDLQPLFSRCEAIAARGIAFSLLNEDPDLIPSDILVEPSRVRALRHSFEAYAQWIDLFCNERNLSLGGDPVHVDRVFSWVEVLHPMHRRLPAATSAEQESVLALNVAITKTLFSLEQKTDLMSYLFSNPRALFLAVDLWVHMPSYFSQSLADGTAPAVALMLSNTVKSMFKFSLGNEAAVILFAELLRTVPDSRRLHRCLVGHLKFLALMRRGDARREAWETHFLLVGTTTTLIGRFRPFRPLSRGIYRRIIEASKLCLHEGYASAVRDAIMALRMLFLGAASCPRGYVCAIELDILGLMARAQAAGIRGGGGALEDDSEIILLHIRASLVFPSVLRAVHRKHGAELSDVGNPKSLTEREFPSLVQFFRRRWDEYTDDTTKERFNGFLQCSNNLADSHERALRYCPCGEAFYCSVGCQKQHWRAVHSRTCRSNDGVWGIGDTIALFEVRDIIRMIHSIITKKRDLIVEGVISAARRIINPPTKEEFWQEITDSWKAGRGTPDPLLAPEMPLEVYIRFDLFSPPTQGRGDFDFQFLLRETHEEVDPDKFLVDVRFELKAEMIDKTLPVVYYVQQLQSME